MVIRHCFYAANEEMLRMYWDIGGMLQQSQDADGWGKKTLQRLAEDLKNDYSEIKGFTVRSNIWCSFSMSIIRTYDDKKGSFFNCEITDFAIG